MNFNNIDQLNDPMIKFIQYQLDHGLTLAISEIKKREQFEKIMRKNSKKWYEFWK